MSDMRRIMLDIESRSTRPDAAIIQIGAIVVGQHELRFNECIDPVLAAMVGHVDRSTDEWWSRQDGEVYRRVWGGYRSPRNVAEQFAAWVTRVRADEIWARGPQFDVCALENLMSRTDVSCPWKYSRVRDLRTLTALVEVDVPREDGLAHDALADAIYQARVLEAILNKLEDIT